MNRSLIMFCGMERLAQLTLLEKLQSESHGRDIVEVAVNKLFTNSDRQEFFEQYVASLMPPDYKGSKEAFRKQAALRVLGATYDLRYRDFESWASVVGPAVRKNESGQKHLK